jgi:hypothetical protein
MWQLVNDKTIYNNTTGNLIIYKTGKEIITDISTPKDEIKMIIS